MPGTAPPSPAFGAVLAELLYYLALAIPVAIGITVAALAVPESLGGVVARRAHRRRTVGRNP
ncbi:hypothetical protein JDV09_18045 [Mycobacterium sp. Y57]|uniref:hypothetical protein n=1 Tax=Mycolicibacterium xanthum TaxID=2796469 RepID=UPI001C85C714|nr:hypothetical protein [Mycolicibacterium xanthum]MBX7433999.1 hypothetical protein [Mycolicibacterium xanthum]